MVIFSGFSDLAYIIKYKRASVFNYLGFPAMTTANVVVTMAPSEKLISAISRVLTG